MKNIQTYLNFTKINLRNNFRIEISMWLLHSPTSGSSLIRKLPEPNQKKIKVKYQEAKYIIDHFPRLMSEIERDTIKYHHFGYKIGKPENYKSTQLYNQKKELVFSKFGVKENDEVKNLIQNGYEQFVINIGNRIEKDAFEEYTLNRCPNCKFIARTPYAKQCRKCSHNWHEEIGGEFQFDTCFRITGRPYLWIVGELLKGHLETGYRIDLTNFQINIIAEIKQIEFCLKSVNGVKKDLPSLGIKVNEKEEELIKRYLTKSAKMIMILKPKEYDD